LPYTSKLNPLYTWAEEYIWVGVFLKCVAKKLGSYELMEKLSL